MRCKACGSNKMIFDPFRGEIFCGDCGLVNGRIYVHKKTKEIMPTLFLGSYTSFSKPRLSAINKRILSDLTRYGNNGTYQKERAYAISEIFRINAVLHLPALVRYQSLQIYEYLIANTTILMDKRITIESLSTAVIMLAMEILDVERDFEEILNASKARKENIEVSFEKAKRFWQERENKNGNNAAPGVRAHEKNLGGENERI